MQVLTTTCCLSISSVPFLSRLLNCVFLGTSAQHYRNSLSHMLEIYFPVVFSLSSEKISYHFSSLLLICVFQTCFGICKALDCSGRP